jgi:hypothetical protein
VLKLLKQNIFIMKLACELLALGALARGHVDDCHDPVALNAILILNDARVTFDQNGFGPL